MKTEKNIEKPQSASAVDAVVSVPDYDLVEHLHEQARWSRVVFGPPQLVDRTEGVLDHMQKELFEIRDNPKDVTEWIDMAMLAFDGAWRNGYSPEQIAAAFRDKLEKNKSRKWPDWRNSRPDKAIEHEVH